MAKPLLTTILTCECRHEQEAIDTVQTRIGGCYKCEGCGKGWARILKWNGASIWIEMSESNMRFHKPFEFPEPEEE